MKSLSLPSLTSNFLQRSGIQIDNSFSTSWKQLGFVSMLTSCGFSKRSGIEATEVVYLLMLWVWLKVDTISMFAKESLLSFSSAKKDVLYDLLN
ncbi:transposase, partial [Parashewanella spongiae]|nr:transposase [Parashewanella spongiae]